MKKVEAVFRSAKFEDVKEALYTIDIHFFTYHPVHGVGNQASEASVYRGVAYAPESIRRTKVEVIVQDEYLEATVQAIVGAAHTGKIGDGRIIVQDVEKVINIRTGQVSEEGL